MAITIASCLAASAYAQQSESPTFNDVDRNLPIDGVAKHAFNAQLYYQRSGFESRLSYTWRDKSLTLEALNITEEDQSQYLQYENLPFTFDSGSRRILVGFRGSF